MRWIRALLPGWGAEGRAEGRAEGGRGGQRGAADPHLKLTGLIVGHFERYPVKIP